MAEAMVGLFAISVTIVIFCENERFLMQNKKEMVAQYEASENLFNESKKILIAKEKVLSQNEAIHSPKKLSAKSRYGAIEVKIQNK
ncbi:hypothetical protein JCM15457_2415 [Liquorilactobacillus sucicola DSM 21376 = JCM 15457]|uniref:Uncharacterized protein n=2 Tax=Liquorilactobacillus sucicola TaxID=519050 RepID=A0A023D0R3_9LACO|nr:hypothetical protein [Liquorilactobacillus sucicola]KRN06443.1 hypothetical protein FD15_GL001064 [Liquorilactobacillus sucicola DSM 21376 = JCM 15457]GAJ27426.1 hypothetical protein JCM15457_2415 [Liquorilactobacillus sucicola DSM 21376 = JCM 15457]